MRACGHVCSCQGAGQEAVAQQQAAQAPAASGGQQELQDAGGGGDRMGGAAGVDMRHRGGGPSLGDPSGGWGEEVEGEGRSWRA
eukprot:scaffold303934_cov17-Tisochrysis_lutea.AAC.1